ncbi:MAG: cytochrome c maturation protein CcmE [Legionellales bacterium]|nr:cytochrome c maturation protein CcmE [Legionellales bacterium]|tara:strand:+ start:23200 stop:23637 length:438 start_codon:yes stop_codon:yes gene_type:complete
MNTRQHQRLVIISISAVLVAISITLVLYALKQNINLFYTPTEFISAGVPVQQTVRLGGYVAANSIRYEQSGLDVTFRITDRTSEIPVHYHGLLPNLFRENQTVIVQGRQNADGQFIASEVLAKHDENYLPASVAKSIKQEHHNAT